MKNKPLKKINRRNKSALQVPLDIPVIFMLVPEPAAEFEKRKEEVQRMIAEMMLKGRVKARKEEE